jgi:hypothetical protein
MQDGQAGALVLIPSERSLDIPIGRRFRDEPDTLSRRLLGELIEDVVRRPSAIGITPVRDEPLLGKL